VLVHSRLAVISLPKKLPKESLRVGTVAVKWKSFTIILLLFSSPLAALAHHSNAEYDRHHQSKLKGTVVEVKWANPHIQIVFEVKGRAGASQRWIGEGPSPSQMIENGWTMTTLKPGDRIIVVGNPPKNGSLSVRLRWVSLPNGKDLFAYSN
jgi:Family of unknown function (DUF6152)